MIDCFPFFNELDLLEIRLNSLAPYVERFVLSECPVTHTGKPKPLYFEENKNRFKDFNITHLVVTEYEGLIGKNPWKLEKYQREYLMNGIVDVDPECIILLSDLDEIPDLENHIGVTGTFVQRLYYYYLNVYTGSPCSGAVAIRRKDILNLNWVRAYRVGHSFPRIYDGGWHFSTLVSDNVFNKLESFAHQEFNIPEVKDKINENIDNLLDPYGRTNIRFKVEMPSGPKWLLNNKNKYEHLFYKERI